MISFLPKYANGKPNDAEKLPIWQEDDDDAGTVSTPPTELERGNTPDSRVKTRNSDEKKATSPRPRNNGFDPEKALPQVESERYLKPARNPPTSSILDLIPLLRIVRWIGRKIFRRGHALKHRKKKSDIGYVESNVPLEIILVLSK